MIAARGDRQGAAGHAISQGWDDGDMIAKAAVGGLESGGANGLHNYVAESFHAIAWPMSLFGKMTQTRPGSFSLTSLSQTGRSAGAWTGQSMAAPMSVPVMSRLAPLPPYKCTALTVASLEAARDAAAEGQLATDLARATALTADQGLVDGLDTDSATRPASIVYGAPTVSSSGDVAADVGDAISAFAGNLTTSCWLTHPAVAAGAGLQIGDGKLGATGGFLAGLPCYVSEAFSLDSSGADLVLVDQQALQVAYGMAQLSVSLHGSIEMADDPAARGDTPTGMTNYIVSMFQADACAPLATMPLSWRLVRDDSVIVVTAALYTGTP
jgi:hypothetical protein